MIFQESDCGWRVWVRYDERVALRMKRFCTVLYWLVNRWLKYVGTSKLPRHVWTRHCFHVRYVTFRPYCLFMGLLVSFDGSAFALWVPPRASPNIPCLRPSYNSSLARVPHLVRICVSPCVPLCVLHIPFYCTSLPMCPSHASQAEQRGADAVGACDCRLSGANEYWQQVAGAITCSRPPGVRGRGGGGSWGRVSMKEALKGKGKGRVEDGYRKGHEGRQTWCEGGWDVRRECDAGSRKP